MLYDFFQIITILDRQDVSFMGDLPAKVGAGFFVRCAQLGCGSCFMGGIGFRVLDSDIFFFCEVIRF